jgi:hypothetical protein
MTEAPPPVEPALEPMPEAPPPAGEGTNGLAIASLICGILSIVSCCLLAGIPAIITGHMALGRIKLSGQGGRGLALAGLVMGYISIVTTIIFLLMGGLAFITGSAAIEPMIEPMIEPPTM